MLTPIFWTTLDSELPYTPDYPRFRGEFFIDGLEGGSMIWVVTREENVYGVAPLNPEFYAEHVKALIVPGAKFEYKAGLTILATGIVTKIA